MKTAVERAKVVKTIQKSSFEGSRTGENSSRRDNEEKKSSFDQNSGEKKEKGEGKQKNFTPRNRFGNGPRECWTCGKTGHFRSDCPENKGNSV